MACPSCWRTPTPPTFPLPPRRERARVREPMKLTWRIHHIGQVRWADETKLAGGALEVSRAQLEGELLRDERLTAVGLHLASPGESCRILPVFDVVEPRVKLEPAGADFPGVLTPVRPVGMGATRVLRGIAVDVLDPNPMPNRVPILDLRIAPVEGAEPAEQSRYS